MLQTDVSKFIEVMTGLSEVYGKKFSASSVDIYFNALAQYDIQSVVSAINAHVKNPDNGQFFPKPADIIRMIGGSSKDSSYIAWSKVESAVKRVGTYESVVFDDEIIHVVITDMGGWVSLGEKTEKEWPFIAKEFIERYQGYKSRHQQMFSYPKKLIGIHEANNSRKGFDVEQPILIGDIDVAKKIFIGGKQKRESGFKRLKIGFDSNGKIGFNENS